MKKSIEIYPLNIGKTMKKSSRDRRVFCRLEKHLPECHQMYRDKDKEKLRQIQYEAITQALKDSRFTLAFFH